MATDLRKFVTNAIRRWGPANGVTIDPALVLAIIQAESSGGRVLETPESGGRRSYGPMMVLDSTARDMGVTDPAQLRDPGLGIWYGVRYLAGLLKQFRGDVARAVSAYNTGPGRAVRSPSGTFPNQTYVDRVLGYMKTFRGAAIPIGALVALGAVAFVLSRRRRAA